MTSDIGHMTDDGQVVDGAWGESLTSHMTSDVLGHMIGDGQVLGGA